MPGLLDTAGIDLAQATHRLQELSGRRRALHLIGLVLTGVGITLVLAAIKEVGIALLVGAGVAFVLSSIVAAERHRLLIRLIVQGDALAIDGVRQLAARLGRDSERRRLAEGLRAAARVGRSKTPNLMIVDPVRASDAADRLASLANSIADPGFPMSSTAIALANALLIDPMRSPLFNPNVPVGDLNRVLDLIERGIM